MISEPYQVIEKTDTRIALETPKRISLIGIMSVIFGLILLLPVISFFAFQYFFLGVRALNQIIFSEIFIWVGLSGLIFIYSGVKAVGIWKTKLIIDFSNGIIKTKTNHLFYRKTSSLKINEIDRIKLRRFQNRYTILIEGRYQSPVEITPPKDWQLDEGIKLAQLIASVLGVECVEEPRGTLKL